MNNGSGMEHNLENLKQNNGVRKKISMKKWFISALVLFGALFLIGCSSPSENKFTPQIVDRGEVLTDSLQQIFSSFDYPAGLIPVMVLEESIGDSLKTSAHADDVFDEICEEHDADDFEDFGLLIYITKEPRLMQIRLGGHYQLYGNLCGVTSGLQYLEIQQQYTCQNSDASLKDMLTMVCPNIVERNNLSWWQRQQLSNIALSINNALDWFGTPSQNFYGTLISKPVYHCISYGNRMFGSWLMGIILVFVIIFVLRWLVKLLFTLLIPIVAIRNFLIWLFSTIISLLYSFSAAGCSMYFSSGRLEDLYAIKAFGIPNVEAFISDPTMFVHDSNIIIAGLFVFLTMFAISLVTLCSDVMVMSTESVSTQMAQWNSLNDKQRGWLIGINKVDKIQPGETPYQAIFAKSMENLGERIGTILVGLSIGALFFFPKAVLWTGIAYSIAKIILKIPRIKILLSRKISATESGASIFWGWIIMTLVFTVASMALNWFIDPFNRNKETVVEQQLAPVYKKVKVTAKTANLRTGPGTNYDFATINNNGTSEKWQVKLGDELDVISEQDGWYKVRISDNPQEVYVKQDLCKDDLNVGLYGSLPNGKSYYVGSMDGFPIEFTITKKKNGKISAVYKNVKFKTVMKLKGETSLEQMGKITFYGTENNRDWFFALNGDKNHIIGIADGDDKELSIELRPK